MERIVHISKSFEEAEEWDLQQYRSMTPEQRLDLVQRLRDEYYTFYNIEKKPIQKVYRIIKLK